MPKLDLCFQPQFKDLTQSCFFISSPKLLASHFLVSVHHSDNHNGTDTISEYLLRNYSCDCQSSKTSHIESPWWLVGPN